jgi:hypothetical protein
VKVMLKFRKDTRAPIDKVLTLVRIPDCPSEMAAIA